ncbi:hypothetical protein ACFQJ7_02855 [Halovenus rubra]|uniref:Uncharacterized protein n=2 Tax=Halovenus rubra TaxID=869890 RepID=A0ACC7E1P3_9EURY|nr:hypothetical protein [Halovenus rubra]
MGRFSLHSALKGALVGAVIVTALFMIDPLTDIWVSGDDLDPQEASKLVWPTTVAAVGGPLVGGFPAGITVGRIDKKQYHPFLEGAVAASAGLSLGIVVWAGVGLLAHGLSVSFSSLIHGFTFTVFGAPLAALIGGYTSKRIAWE